MDKKLAFIVCCSVVVHAIVLVIIDHQFRVHKPLKLTNVSTNPIKARLVIPLKKPKVRESKPSAPVAKSLVNEAKKASEDSVKPAQPIVKSLVKESEMPPDDNKPIEPQIEPKPLSGAHRAESKIVKPNASAILAASKRHVARRIGDQSVSYPTNKGKSVSVMTGVPDAHHYIPDIRTEEEKRVIKITCDTAIKGALTTLSDFMGGTLTCQSQPNLDDFLPKRKRKQ